MTPRQILFLGQTAALGGAELCLLDVASHFRERSLVALMADGPLRVALEARGVRVCVLEAGRLQRVKRDSRMPGPGAVGTVIRAAHAVSKLARGYDLLYANSQKAFVVACTATMFVHRPVLWHLHDMLDQKFFSRVNIGVDVFLANHVASGVIANSRATADALLARGATGVRVDVIYNGFDPAIFDSVAARDVAGIRSSLGIGDAPLLGLFGRLAPWKGQDVAVHALSLLHEFPTLQLAIVGDALFGEEDYVARLHAAVATAGLTPRVHFLGFRSDIPALYRAVDVVLHTSTAPEPFGRVIVEGMFAERPVIATAGGGASEIVDAGITAWQVPPNDPAALAAAIADVLRNPAKARAVAKAGRESALRRFTLQETLPLIDRAIEHAVAP